MARARPIISTKVWGPVDHLRDGASGLLVPIDSAALSEAILRFAADPEEATAMGSAAREYALAHFTEAAFEHDLLRTYLDAMRRHRS
jgi:glycosyltransferase involved in cell wall biosynthesis